MKKLLLIGCIIVVSAKASAPSSGFGAPNQAAPSDTSLVNDPNFGGVQPLNSRVPAWTLVDNIIQPIINGGFTTFVSAHKPGENPERTLTESDLPKLRSGNLRDNEASFLQTGVFTIDWNKLAEGIQKGTFEQLIYNRLLISEYLLGRVVLCATALQDTPFMSNTYSAIDSDKNILDTFIKTGQQYLLQTRYLRNAFTPQVNKASSNANQQNQNGAINWNAIANNQSGPATQAQSGSYANYLSPADTFTGLVLVNASGGSNSFTVGSSSNQVPPGHVGLYTDSSASHTEYANKWASQSSDNKWGKKRSVSFFIEGMPGQGSITLYQNENNLPQIASTGPNGTSVINFDSTILGKFFATPHPWAIVVKSTASEGLKVIGLAKLNVYRFPEALKFNGVQALKLRGGQDSEPDFFLGNVLYAPKSLYRLTISNANVNAGQPYPFASWVLQGLFNGHLQSSFYKPLANPSYGQIQWRQKWDTPTAAQWFAQSSSIDWKFLRALLVTQAAQETMYINPESMDQIEAILANPQQPRPELWYIGATDTYVPVVPVLAQNNNPAPQDNDASKK